MGMCVCKGKDGKPRPLPQDGTCLKCGQQIPVVWR